MDTYTDLQLLDELIRRASERAKQRPGPGSAATVLNCLKGAKTFLLTLADMERDHAE